MGRPHIKEEHHQHPEGKTTGDVLRECRPRELVAGPRQQLAHTPPGEAFQSASRADDEQNVPVRPQYVEASPQHRGHVGDQGKLMFLAVHDGLVFGHTNSYLVR